MGGKMALVQKVEDYGKVSAAVGAFTAGALSLVTTVKMHNHDTKEAKKAAEGK